MSATLTPVAPEAVVHAPFVRSLFSRVIVGVDGSPESLEAARQAARLMDGRGSLELVAAYPTVYSAAITEMTAGTICGDQKRYEREAVCALERACAVVADVEAITKTTERRPVDALLDEAMLERATLVAVGPHGRSRLAGIVLGSVATEIMHRAPCSVLIARQQPRPFRRRIVVGIDGSPQATAAYALAADLADRLGARLWPVVALGGEPADRAAIDALTRSREDLPDEPVRALVKAASDADLLVVGSRGLHGLKALGSVSERVAHQARCSTLIVRDPQRA